jgi:hypothetical protein
MASVQDQYRFVCEYGAKGLVLASSKNFTSPANEYPGTFL